LVTTRSSATHTPLRPALTDIDQHRIKKIEHQRLDGEESHGGIDKQMRLTQVRAEKRLGQLRAQIGPSGVRQCWRMLLRLRRTRSGIARVADITQERDRLADRQSLLGTLLQPLQ
jgi:hypothetical protein